MRQGPARLRARSEDGFSLVELLVVIIIIGLLAAIAIPIFLNQRKKAVEASLKSDLRTVAHQMETNFVDAKTYPTFTASNTPSIGGVTVKLSKSNTVASLAAGAATGTFCLQATNSSVGTTWYYDSDKGGLIGTTACS